MFNLYRTIIAGKNYRLNQTYKDMVSRHQYLNEPLIMTKTHLCYTNETRKMINMCYVKRAIKWKKNIPSIRDEKSKRIKTIWEKCKVIAYPSNNMKQKPPYYNNQEFTVKKLHNTPERYITLLDSITNEEMIITKDQLNDFDYGYCITIHKSQGSSIDTPFFVWEIDYAPNKELVYVGISRTTSKANCKIGTRHQLKLLKTYL